MKTVGFMAIGVCFLGAVGAAPAWGTTIVVKMESNRIILAADTRRNTLEKYSNPKTEHAFHDDSCKVIALGKSGFAATGNSDYERVELGDMVSDWSAFQ